MKSLWVVLAGLVLFCGWGFGMDSGEGELGRRVWVSGEAGDGSVACLGNGRLCVYEEGPVVIQLFGPPYSTGSIMRMEVAGAAELACESARRVGTGIWDHEFMSGGKAAGRVVDFVDTELPCFVREVEGGEGIRFVMRFAEGEVVERVTGAAGVRGAEEGLLIRTAAGQAIYNDYPFPRRQFHRVAVTGDARLVKGADGRTWEILCGGGKGTVYVCGGSDLPECTENMEKALSEGGGRLLSRSSAWWEGFTGRRIDFGAKLPADARGRERLLRAIDDVAVLIKTQTGEDGGVLAGYNYHLAYVRDQYGVFRCLLKLGYLEEAKGILERYWRIWERYGKLNNATGIGVDGVFHVHENDEVEVTGYLIIQAFDYAEAAGDEGFVGEIGPMLEWAFEAQAKHLAGGMLPFNGDETYVAGAILPRDRLNDGSAEATMLFLTGGRRLVDWAERRGAWGAERVAAARKVLEETEGRYYANFWRDGELIANNPERAKIAELPRFRHGVCEKSVYEVMSGVKGAEVYFGWTVRNGNGRYVSPFDAGAGEFPAAEEKVYVLKSVSLMPFYVGSEVLKREDVEGMLRAIEASYRETGAMPSRPEGDVNVGYDYGLLLYNLAMIDSELAGEVYDKMMSLIDATGAWVEYYEGGKGRGTRCRPWESGISLEAAISYAMRGEGE